MNVTRTAEEHLAVIRTLMERAATYRRALAPIFLITGLIGGVTAMLGAAQHVENAFIVMWLVAALVTVTLAFLMTRRAALRAREALWSAPARRVAGALVPPLLAGAIWTGLWLAGRWSGGGLLVIAVWQLLYGCALHAAGFLTPRAVRWLGAAFMAAGLATFAADTLAALTITPALLHGWMGATFGGLHLLCGLYLTVTQKETNAA